MTVHHLAIGASKDRTNFDTPKGHSRHLTVFGDGVKDVGTRPGKEILNFFEDQGDVLKAYWTSHTPFTRVTAINQLRAFCAGYEEVTLVGGSWGGLVLYDVLRFGMGATEVEDGKTKLILADAPFDGSDIADSLSRYVARLPARLRLPAGINRKLMTSKSSLPFSLLATDADRKLSAQHHKLVGELSIGVLASRLHALYNRPVNPLRRMLDGITVCDLRTPGDPLVKVQARSKWAAVSPTFHPFVVAKDDSIAQGHVAMFEYREEWLHTLKAAFAA